MDPPPPPRCTNIQGRVLLNYSSSCYCLIGPYIQCFKQMTSIMTLILQNHHAYTSCAKSHLYCWEERPAHYLAFTLHLVMKMGSIFPVNAELQTAVVIRSAGVWTEMEARLKDLQSVVSIQNNTEQTLISFWIITVTEKLDDLGFSLLQTFFHQISFIDWWTYELTSKFKCFHWTSLHFVNYCLSKGHLHGINFLARNNFWWQVYDGSYFV